MRPLVALSVLAAILAGCAQEPAALDRPGLACIDCAVLAAEGFPYFWEPHIAVDPHDPARLVAAVTLPYRTPSPEAGADLFGDDMLVAFSRDAGATWATTRIPHGPSAPVDHPLRTARALADPNVVFLPDGAVVVSGLGYNYAGTPLSAHGQGFRIWLARFEQDAQEPEVTLVVPMAPGLGSFGSLGHLGVLLDSPDAPTLALAPDGSLHLHYRKMIQATPTEPERSRLMAQRSDDGGRTWTPAVPVVEGRNSVSAMVLALTDGAVLGATGGWGVDGVTATQHGYQLVTRSMDRGRTWTHVQLDDEHLPSLSWWPTLAASDAGVHVAYSANGAGGRERLMLRNSTDGGLTFGPAVEIAAPPAQGALTPTFGSDGTRAVLTWFEPQSGGRYHLMARSLDARGMSPAITLDDTLQEDATALGEYFGVAVAGDRAWAVWTSNAGGGELRVARLAMS